MLHIGYWIGKEFFEVLFMHSAAHLQGLILLHGFLTVANLKLVSQTESIILNRARNYFVVILFIISKKPRKIDYSPRKKKIHHIQRR